MYADKINAGLAKGLSFQETFGVEADGSLDELRRTFLVKAFQRRQVALLNHLAGVGYPPETIVSLMLMELDCLPVDDEGANLGARYLEPAAVVDRWFRRARVIARTEPRLNAGNLSAYISGLRRRRRQCRVQIVLLPRSAFRAFDLGDALSCQHRELRRKRRTRRHVP